MNIKNQKDFFSGLLFMLAGLGFAWAASRYPLGQAAAMGPGYVPLLLGTLLALLGGLVVFKALVFETEDGGRIGRWAWRPILWVVLANLACAALLAGLPAWGLPSQGLVAAVFALSLLAGRASTPWRWKEQVLLALVLALASTLVWGVWLQLPVSLWPLEAAGPLGPAQVPAAAGLGG